MAIPTFNAVGFCAHFSKQGDWAFDVALKISKTHDKTLNVFRFLIDPFDPNDIRVQKLSRQELEKLAIKEEKDLRLYYDRRAGEYLDVGFRICYNDSWTELHRCLLVREFQLLVLAYPRKGVTFAHRPIEEFANGFISPVVLVGPDSPDQFLLNSRAALLTATLGLSQENWKGVKIAQL